MAKYERRRFLEISAAAAVAAGVTRGARPADSSQEGARKPMRLGLIVGAGNDPERAIAKVHKLGVPTCQVGVDSFGPEMVTGLRRALDRYGIEATSLVIGGPGPEEYDFYNGPLTIGFVPREWRAKRIERAKQASDFAKKCGIPAVQTHCGFLPENPNDPVYKETIEAIREVVSYCKRNGQNFRYETGQETPITLVRAIQDVGLDNQGVNFDVANLILYGKANPVDAVEIIGPYVQGVHAKDGLWPTGPRNLGKVDFPRVIRRLKELNYRGAITIEREISGPQQMEDIRKEKVYLEKLIG
ncbi:MAG: xylose isomerase [Acidobacteria bacterium]|nr:MAG: xylose isomerase [Acidobacteriota bacterium]